MARLVGADEKANGIARGGQNGIVVGFENELPWSDSTCALRRYIVCQAFVLEETFGTVLLIENTGRSRCEQKAAPFPLLRCRSQAQKGHLAIPKLGVV